MPHKDPEARRAYMRAYKAEHRERMRELNKQSYERNRDAILERRAERADLIDAETKRAKSKEYQRAYRERHRDEISRRNKERRAGNPEAARAYDRLWRARNPEAIRASHQRYQEKHHDDINARRRRRRDAKRGGPPPPKLSEAERRERRHLYAKSYQQKHPERAKEASRRWRDRHPSYGRDWSRAHVEERREPNRAWHVANRERRRLQKRDNYRKDPAKYIQWTRAHQARKANAYVEHVDYAEIRRRDHGICGICHKKIAAGEPIAFDHILPLSQGGTHCPANVQLAHRDCNCRKGAGRIPSQLRLIG